MRKIGKGEKILGLVFILAVTAFCYVGQELWLNYSPVPENLRSAYQNICKSLVLSNPESDTLKNAKTEFDIAIPKLLGGSALPEGDGAGAIVLAPKGSSLIPSSISFDKVNDEGFIIKSLDGKTYITGKNEIGVLRGAFYFLRLMQLGKSIDNLDIIENPYFPYRVLDHWYNHYGSNPDTERVYGGNRVFRMENFGRLSATEKERIIKYCRLAVSLGLNGMCPDNVNTYRSNSLKNYTCLEEANLKTQKIFADIIGTYGLKYYLSVSYASPRIVSPTMSTANAYQNEDAKKWWFNKVDMVRNYIKNFGGFLMKADSEGEEGPRSSYNLNQSQGANPMAEALKRYGYVLIWRTFIYDTSDPDFAVNQSKEFANQTWDSSIIIRMKDGPRDFQVVEPPHQLLTQPELRHGMEFQITQEYTGQAIHVCWLVPKWKKILDWDMKPNQLRKGVEGSITYQILRGDGTAQNGGGVWGISNFSDTVNWTAHFFHQANSYGYGRLGWDPTLSAQQIADEWIRCSFENGYEPAIRYIVGNILSKSWKTYEDYTISYSALMPALQYDDHYEISFSGMRSSRFYSDYFMNFKSDGIGVDRTTKSGNGMVKYYYSTALKDSFENIEKCPEDYILFFHHLPWEYKMKSGMTLIQSLYHNHYRGLKQIKKFINNWTLLKKVVKVDDELHTHIKTKLNHQLRDATRWVETFKKDFGAYYKTPVPCDMSIITPDSNSAVTIPVDGSVELSVKLKDQTGKDITSETFKWTIVEDNNSNCGGGSLNVTEGEKVTFTANKEGVFIVKASTGTWDALSDYVQIFVGDWPKVVLSGGCSNVNFQKVNIIPKKFKIQYTRNGILITKPSLEGKIEIFRLNGTMVEAFNDTKTNMFIWNTKNSAKGIYIAKFTDKNGCLSERFVLK